MHWSVELERIFEAQFFADLPHRRHDFLAEQADAGLGVFWADRTVVTPQAVDARARFFEDPTKFRDYRVGRAVNDPPVGDLLFERRASTRALRPPDRELDKLAAMVGREIARRARPNRMRKTSEFALHPQELAGVLLRLLFTVGDMNLLQISAILGASGIADLERHLVVKLPDLLGRLDRGVERDIGIALLGRPDDGLFAQHPGDPNPRVGLLQRHRPGVDDAVLVMRALPAEWPLARPRRDHQIVRLLEALTVVGRADPGGQLLLPAAADKARDQAPFRDHVDHRQLFGEPHRVLGQG